MKDVFDNLRSNPGRGQNGSQPPAASPDLELAQPEQLEQFFAPWRHYQGWQDFILSFASSIVLRLTLTLAQSCAIPSTGPSRSCFPCGYKSTCRSR